MKRWCGQCRSFVEAAQCGRCGRTAVNSDGTIAVDVVATDVAPVVKLPAKPQCETLVPDGWCEQCQQARGGAYCPMCGAAVEYKQQQQGA